MKAAERHKVRPTALILGKGSQKPWTRTDVTLAKAYERFTEELCQQCGLPKYMCHTDDNRIQFKLSRDECASNAMAEREQAVVGERAQKNPNAREFGVRVGAEPYLTKDAVADGIEFSDLRRPYLIDQAKKRGLIPDETVSGNPE